MSLWLQTQGAESLRQSLFERRSWYSLLFIRYQLSPFPTEGRSYCSNHCINFFVLTLLKGIRVSIITRVILGELSVLTFVSLISKLECLLGWVVAVSANHGISQGSQPCRRRLSGHFQTLVYLESVTKSCYLVWFVEGAPRRLRKCCLAIR